MGGTDREKQLLQRRESGLAGYKDDVLTAAALWERVA